jgi:hypothetical protein
MSGRIKFQLLLYKPELRCSLLVFLHTPQSGTVFSQFAGIVQVTLQRYDIESAESQPSGVPGSAC